MPPLSHSRWILQGLRQSTKIFSLPIRGQRWIATKHPKGFYPPAREDLEELRERTQEFARKHVLLLVTSFSDTPTKGEKFQKMSLRGPIMRTSFPTRCGGSWAKPGSRIQYPGIVNSVLIGWSSFLGITADEDYGGLAMGYQAHCVVMEELSRASGVW